MDGTDSFLIEERNKLPLLEHDTSLYYWRMCDMSVRQANTCIRICCGCMLAGSSVGYVPSEPPIISRPFIYCCDIIITIIFIAVASKKPSTCDHELRLIHPWSEIQASTFSQFTASNCIRFYDYPGTVEAYKWRQMVNLLASGVNLYRLQSVVNKMDYCDH